jgi:hypothetical protein
MADSYECNCSHPDPTPEHAHRVCPIHGELATAWALVNDRLPEGEPEPIALSILRKVLIAGRGGSHGGRLYLSEQDYDEGIQADLTPAEDAVVTVLAPEED